MKTLYEVNWHYKDKSQSCFSHCTVTPIKVIREGYLPDCSNVTITAIDSNGMQFINNPNNYYISEELAWKSVRESLIEEMNENDNEIDRIRIETFNMMKFLMSLPME